VDIYDGENEPTIFHGKTLTSKVSLREVCEVIAKYGFIASPYPIIISAEVHCSLPQQDLIAEIMIEVFGNMLVRKLPGDAPIKLKADELPSPEDLKGKILFKTKNPELSGTETFENDSGFSTEPSSSASDSDALMEALQDALASSPASAPASVPASTGVKMKQRSQSGQIKGRHFLVHFIVADVLP
jgi:phosphatidylinositol phospholipase C delta